MGVERRRNRSSMILPHRYRYRCECPLALLATTCVDGSTSSYLRVTNWLLVEVRVAYRRAGIQAVP